MAYRVDMKLKCLACGFGIIIEEKKEETVTCPKCHSKFVLSEEDGELSLEYA